MAMYNAEATVRATVQSLIDQTFPDWELIAVDDASRDGTVPAVESFGDRRIRVIRQEENAGQAASLTRGLEEARSSLIARIDADDLCLPGRLETQVPWIQARPDIAVLGARAEIFDDDHRVLGVASALRTRADQLRTCLIRNRIANHVSVIARRDLMLAFGGYSAALPVLADFHLWTRLLLTGHRIAEQDAVLVRIRRAAVTFSASTASSDRLPREYATFYRLLATEFDAAVTEDEATSLGRVVAAPPEQLENDDIVGAVILMRRFLGALLERRSDAAESRSALRAPEDLFWEHVARRVLAGKYHAALQLVRLGRKEAGIRIESPATTLAWWLKLGKYGRRGWAPPVPGGSALESRR